jgi:hypothetical protein
MEKALVISTVISILFAIFKFIEMKYIHKHLKPLKDILRDIVIVFLSSFLTLMVFLYYQNRIEDFIAILTNTNILKSENTEVFTGHPNF